MSISGPLAAEVKAFRASIGLSQVQFADLLGVSRRTVEEWEKPGSKPPGYLRYAFAAINAGLAPYAKPDLLHITPDGDGWRIRVSTGDEMTGSPLFLQPFPSLEAATAMVDRIHKVAGR